MKNQEVKTYSKSMLREEVDILMVTCSNLRDKLLIKLLFESGSRPTEIASLLHEDFNIATKEITVKCRKTHCQRNINVSPDLINLYLDYIAEYNKVSNYVFPNLSGGINDKPMTPDEVTFLFKRLRKKIDLHVTPSMFRHVRAGRILEEISQNIVSEENVVSIESGYCKGKECKYSHLSCSMCKHHIPFRKTENNV